ncbi:MAG: hypothetical protein RI922_2206 [Bacteroidota bacterium]|jgi:hypothetical protein
MKLKFIYTGVIATIILSSCGSDSINDPSACDCANLYENNPMKKDYTPEQMNDGDFLQEEANNYVETAKNCAIKFGNLDDMDKEIAKSTLEMNMIPKLDEAIENAKKECN